MTPELEPAKVLHFFVEAETYYRFKALCAMTHAHSHAHAFSNLMEGDPDTLDALRKINAPDPLENERNQP